MVDMFRVSQYPSLEYDCSKLQLLELIFDQGILGYACIHCTGYWS